MKRSFDYYNSKKSKSYNYNDDEDVSNQDDYDDDDEYLGVVDKNDFVKNKTSNISNRRCHNIVSSRKGSNSRENIINLPGGYGAQIKEFVPVSITQAIREYVDVVFGTAFIHAKDNCDINITFPFIIQNILQFNGILFERVSIYKINEELPEPLWFTYTDNVYVDSSTSNTSFKSELVLYYNESMVRNMQKLNNTVHIDSGIVPLDYFNPKFPTPLDINTYTPSLYNAVVLCDHVSQHIIYDIYSQLDEKQSVSTNNSTESCVDIENKRRSRMNRPLHENWTKYGTTFSSMLKITAIYENLPEPNKHMTTYFF